MLLASAGALSLCLGKIPSDHAAERAAAAIAVPALVVDRVDGEHDSEQEHVVDPVRRVDGELLPEGELARDGRHQPAVQADRVVPASEAPLGGKRPKVESMS